MADFLRNLLEPFQRDIPYDDPGLDGGWADAEDEFGGNAGSPIEVLGGFAAKILEARDFRPGWFRADEWATVGAFEIPPGILTRINEGVPYRMYIKGVHRVAGLNGAAAAPRTITALPGLVRTTQGLPALPSLFHPEVVVWTAPAPGTVFTQQPVSAVDYTARSVTYTEPANTTQVEVYYVHDVGEWRFRVQRALGVADTVAISVANGSFGAVHTVDQNNRETSHRWPQLVTLIPRHSIVFEVRTSVEVTFHARAQQMLNIQTHVAQVRINDLTAAAELVEAGLRS